MYVAIYDVLMQSSLTLALSYQEHLKMCPMVPIECEACNVELKRGELDTHLKNDCPEAEVECTYSDQGCPKRVRRNLEYSFVLSSNTNFFL